LIGRPGCDAAPNGHRKGEEKNEKRRWDRQRKCRDFNDQKGVTPSPRLTKRKGLPKGRKGQPASGEKIEAIKKLKKKKKPNRRKKNREMKRCPWKKGPFSARGKGNRGGKFGVLGRGEGRQRN